METLDTPLQLKFDNGSIFPKNLVIIAYVVLPLSLFAIFASWIVGIIMLVLALTVSFGKQWVEIDAEQQTVREYNSFIGFIKVGKTKSIKDHKYITIMPLIESTQVNASYANSTTISSAFSMVVLFKERLKGKTIITKFEQKNEAVEVAQKLCGRLSMQYFDYDPKLVRDILLGNRRIV